LTPAFMMVSMIFIDVILLHIKKVKSLVFFITNHRHSHFQYEHGSNIMLESRITLNFKESCDG